MKKTLSALLALVMVLTMAVGLSACSGGKGDDGEGTTSVEATTKKEYPENWKEFVVTNPVYQAQLTFYAPEFDAPYEVGELEINPYYGYIKQTFDFTAEGKKGQVRVDLLASRSADEVAEMLELQEDDPEYETYYTLETLENGYQALIEDETTSCTITIDAGESETGGHIVAEVEVSCYGSQYHEDQWYKDVIDAVKQSVYITQDYPEKEARDNFFVDQSGQLKLPTSVTVAGKSYDVKQEQGDYNTYLIINDIASDSLQGISYIVQTAGGIKESDYTNYEAKDDYTATTVNGFPALVKTTVYFDSLSTQVYVNADGRYLSFYISSMVADGDSTLDYIAQASDFIKNQTADAEKAACDILGQVLAAEVK